MKKFISLSFVIVPLVFLVNSCNDLDSNINEPTDLETKPLALKQIDNIYTAESFVIVKAKYNIPNSCWTYHKTETIGNDSVLKIIVSGKFLGNNCDENIKHLTHIDTIRFKNAGFKKLRFWLSESSYIDTTIIFAKHYNTNFPDFFIEKGNDTDSSYISLRGTKIHPFSFEIVGTGWGIVESGLILQGDYKDRKLFFYMMGECGTTLTKTWVKRSLNRIVTADILDTISTIAFANLFNCKDTIYVIR